jgi:hypothetical protein
MPPPVTTKGRSGPGEVDQPLQLGARDQEHGSSDVEADAGAAAPTADAAQAPRGSVPLPAVLARLEDSPFIGRAAALRRLRDRWENASRGTGGLVVVAGEPGIGKARLAARFASAVHAEGAVVLCGRADEESVWPYQPFVEALRPYAAHRPGLVEQAGLPPAAAQALARLVPELGAPAGPGRDRHGDERERDRHGDERERDRHELFEAVVRLLLDAAQPNGLLLVLKDLDCADDPTWLLLRHVLRRGQGSRLLVLATDGGLTPQGSESLPRPLADLRGEAELDTIRLEGLQPAEVAALAAARGGEQSVDGVVVQRLCDETGGNPFFIQELLRTPREARDDSARVPEAVKHVIGRRLDRLAPVALETLTLAAVLGNDFRLTTLEAIATDREQEELIESLESAVAAGLIFEDPEEVDRFSFTHAIVRETLYERPIASRRLRLHRRVAEALEVAPLAVHPAELAHHYYQAREVGAAAKAIVYNLAAAEEAQQAHAYEAAAEHYERALSVLPIIKRDDDVARCDVLLALGAARWQASDPDPRSTFVQALDLARGLDSPDRLARAALGAGGRFYAPGSTDLAYTKLLDEVLGALEPGGSALRVRVLARLAENLIFAQPEQRARQLASEAVDMARRIGEPDALAAALMGCHASLLHVEYAEERRRIGDETVALAGELEAPELAALARHWLLYDLAELGELDEARSRQAELDRLAEELQQPLYRHSALSWRGVWTGLQGDFREAERLARDSMRLAEHARAPDAEKHFTAQLVAVRREQGRLDELLPKIERLADDDPAAAAWCAVLPLAYLDAGDKARARDAYDRALAVASGPRTMLWLTAMSSLCEAAAQLDDAEGGARLYAELVPYADRLIQWSFTGNAGSVERVLGRTAAVAGQHDEACVHFEAALIRHSELDAAALLARTRCDYGELLLRGPRTDRPRADGLLRDATAAGRRLGMAGVAARAGQHG